MRWIDIALPTPGSCPEFDRQLDEARTICDSMPDLQARLGLDTPALTRGMEQVGRLLFGAVTGEDGSAFDPAAGRPGAVTPERGLAIHDQLVGYHLVGDATQTALPWHWLHNGVEFLLEKFPVTAGDKSSRIPEIDPDRIWMQRQSDALFAGQEPCPRDRPEILFVPGHSRDEIRRLMFREADGIDQALAAGSPVQARLRIPGAVTPGLLASRAMLYQALHFAAPTSQPPEVSGAGENRWLAGLMAAAGQPDAGTVDDLVGLDLEIVGVDPVEAALDQALEAYTRRGVPAPVGGRADVTVQSVAPGWMLDDGPVVPEDLGRTSCLPPLVFSNSWCSLGWLGQRFLDSGASTFVGTAVPLFSRPARLFAAFYYGALGQGVCAGAALRQAALALRDRLGPEHPAWLAYGLQGYGCLRLIDL
jgi:hypothetical protein